MGELIEVSRYCLYVAVVMTISFIVCVKPYLVSKKNKPLGFLLLAIVYFCHDMFWSYWHRGRESWEVVECFIVYVLFLVILHTQFKGKLLHKFGVTFTLDFLMQISAQVFSFIIAAVLVDFQMEKIIPYLMELTLQALLCLIFSLIAGVALAIQLFKLMSKIKRTVLDGITCCLGVIGIALIIWNSPQCLQIALPTFLFVLLINLFFQNRMNKQMKQQFAYYSQISQYEEENQKQISKLRHDMANHIEVVNALSEEYAAELSRNLQESIPAQTGIKVVDCLLYLKEQECQKNGIELKTDIVSLQKMLVTELDMVSLLTNLMDNAIEACQNTEGEKKINLSMKRKQDYLMLTIINNKDEKHRPIATGFKTLKKMGKEHGFGTQIIRDIVQKYDGYIEYHDLGEVMEFYCSLCTWND